MNLFNSFWMAGFECSDQMNAFGNRVDLLKKTGHIEYIREDYSRLRDLNISTVREGIRWSVVEKRPYQYDWTDVIVQFEAAKEMNIQIVWDMCHFGYPNDLTPLHPKFAQRFAALCRGFVELFRVYNPHEPLIITPINEVSFISWLGGDVKGTVPYCINYGWEVKYALMKAYIEGCAAIKSTDANAHILITEPLINIAPSCNEQYLDDCKIKNNEQFQVLDMLTGRICPELGGREEYLDILGFNYYSNNQWRYPEQEFICWKTRDAEMGWRPFHEMVAEAWARYDRPFIIAETSHPQEDRPLWINYIVEESMEMIKADLPLSGICLYPIIDRPDWDHTDLWHKSGVWDIYDTQSLARTLHKPTFDAILAGQKQILELQETFIHT